jgi:hypothetical protein
MVARGLLSLMKKYTRDSSNKRSMNRAVTQLYEDLST